MKIEFSFPCNRKHGPFKITGKASSMETAEENALWHYNKAIEHDGFAPVDSFPPGTTQKEIHA
jgi:hypothetical protein